jgi:hypothetical protein
MIDTCSLVSIGIESYFAEIIGVRMVLLAAGIFTVAWNLVAVLVHHKIGEEEIEAS